VRQKILYIFLPAAFLVLAWAELRFGSVWIPWNRFREAFTGEGSEVYRMIIWDYRFPKMWTAILAGAGLSLAGLLLQTLFRNPIVGPYVLGISSGAGLGIALAMAGALAVFMTRLPVSLTFAAAVAGSTAVLALDIWLYRRIPRPESLLVAGIMAGAFAGAVLGILLIYMPAARLQKYFFWTAGNLGNVPPLELAVMASAVLTAFGWSAGRIKYLNQMLLGDEYAEASGVHLHRLRLEIIILTGMVTGIVTAVTGPLAFTGLMVPHLARLLLRTWQHQYLLPAVFLLGASFMMAVDLVSQLPGAPGTLPVNSITALVGAPWVVWLLLKNNREV